MIEVLCSRCERSLPSENFKPDPRYKSGFTAWCKECHREKNREWYALNKAKHNRLIDEATRQPDMFVQHPAPAATQEAFDV